MTEFPRLLPGTKRVFLALLSEIESFPHSVQVGADRYFLVQGPETGYSLLSAVCPHMGGQIVCAEGAFSCPVHGWCFHGQTGETLIGRHPSGLERFAVEADGPRLYAHLPTTTTGPPAGRHRSQLPGDLILKLHAHACFELSWARRSLLFDPWLDGPAFLGAWIQYPAPTVDPRSLQPDAIVLTHEHSDHFHERTLRHFARDTPVYVPDFPRQRLQRLLAEMGFVDVRPALLGERVQIDDGLAVTFFGPTHHLNDSIVLVEIGDSRILNLNDAGINASLANQIGPVNIVAAAFSIGASGYPLAWDHLSDEEKQRLQEDFARGKLEMLRTAADLYDAEYLLPFAGHFTLWHPGHRQLVAALKKNTLEAVVDAFAESPTQVIDLVPGEEWRVETGFVGECATGARRFPQTQNPFGAASILRYLEETYDDVLFAESSFDLEDKGDPAELDRYFLELGQVPEIAFCEDLVFRVQLYRYSDGLDGADRLYRVTSGRIQILSGGSEQPGLEIRMPGGVFLRIARERLPWDEAYVGYWCRMRKNEERYAFGFWRLLHSPFSGLQSDDKHRAADAESPGITADTIIADLIERHGELATRVLHRHGLYCSGCALSTGESLRFGARLHAIGPRQLEHLLQELNVGLRGRPRTST